MKRNLVAIFCCLPLALATTGCYTTISVNFGNGTPSRIMVRSMENGREATVPPGKFRKIPNGSGDLVVTREAGQSYRFPRVAPFDVDRKYQAVGHSIFGPNSVTLKALLQTNMELYVLMPDEKSVNPSAQQPSGYPKRGEKTSQ